LEEQMTGTADFEGLLRQALAPVEPPEHLATRLEHGLQSITEMAGQELDALELSAMRDPRNWARPAAAVVLGAGAGAAGAAVSKTLRDVEQQTRRLLRSR
jgi:hypothetical protein